MHAGNFSIANDLLLLCLTGALGLALGSLRIKGFSLGIAGVLFSGLFFGQLGLSISPQIAHFIREFGLILFVYTIGLQVGPGFFSSLKHRGLLLNLLATAIVLLGTSLVIFTFYSLRFDIGEITGIFSGATTNTPSLGAAQEAIQRSPTAQNSTPPALAYAICYPFGVLGILLSMLILKRVGKKEISAEEQKFLEEQEKENPPVSDLTLLVTNPNVVGKNLDELPGMSNSGIVISRLRREGQIRVARPDDRFQVGDVILAIGPSAALESLRIIVGTPVPDDLRSSAPGVSVRRIIVTRREAIGQTLQNLGLELKYQVTFTRLLRGEVELPAPTRLRLHAGDILTVVGSEADLDQVARELGNSMQDLNLPRVIPIFAGIVLGILLGSIPIVIPGLPSPLKLGNAGGPLIAAILLSHFARIGPFVWYLPLNANFLLREIGIVLFLSVVGINSGTQIGSVLTSGQGILWLATGVLVTILPLILVGSFAMFFLKVNFLTILGLLAGSTTDPPALAFANSLTKTAAPSLAYSTVYPLTMLLRVLFAQILVIFLT